MIDLAGEKIEGLGSDAITGLPRARFLAFISAARRSKSDLVTGPNWRNCHGSDSRYNTPFVDEKASGLDVDDYVVAHRRRGQQASTEPSKAGGKSLEV
jgi:hypothetical protein